MEYEKYYSNQMMINYSEMNNPNKNDIKSKATVKIQLSNGIGTGFFIKLERNKKPFYCLMTNQHVITPEMIQNKEIISIFDNEERLRGQIKLNQKERIIICFLELLKIDATLVEIIPKDNIYNQTYFLLPYNNIEQDIGISIVPIAEYLKNYKRNGEGIEYYENGKNEYVGGAFYYPNEDYYIDVNKNGKGYEYYSNGELFMNDKYINNEEINQNLFQNDNNTINNMNMNNYLNNNILNNNNSINNNVLYSNNNLYNTNNNNNIIESNNVYKKLYLLGSLFNSRCNVCNHFVKNHKEYQNSIWICKECPEKFNLCKFL